MKRLIWPANAVLALLLCAEIASATTFSWLNPTHYEDGSLLPLGELDNIALLCAGNPSPSAILASQTMILVEAPPQEADWDLPDGQHYCAARALAGGVFSDLSNIVSVLVQTSPNAPTDLEASPPIDGPLETVSESVYVITQAEDYIGTDWIGTAPVGTPCDPTSGVNGLYRVDMAYVTPAGDAGPIVAVAECARTE